MVVDTDINHQDNDKMVISKDPREGVSSIPETGVDAPTFTALHYALATKVDAIVDRQVELTRNISDVAAEMRVPKPQPWGIVISAVIGLLAIMGTVGGLVHQSISDRIEVNTRSLAEVERRSEKRDDSFASKHQFEDSIQLLRETTRRLEDVQIAARKAELEINVTKAEFSAVSQSIKDRQLRNEGYIEETRKAEALNNRINQLYELYRQLQAQALTNIQTQATAYQQQSHGNSK